MKEFNNLQEIMNQIQQNFNIKRNKIPNMNNILYFNKENRMKKIK